MLEGVQADEFKVTVNLQLAEDSSGNQEKTENDAGNADAEDKTEDEADDKLTETVVISREEAIALIESSIHVEKIKK